MRIRLTLERVPVRVVLETPSMGVMAGLTGQQPVLGGFSLAVIERQGSGESFFGR